MLYGFVWYRDGKLSVLGRRYSIADADTALCVRRKRAVWEANRRCCGCGFETDWCCSYPRYSVGAGGARAMAVSMAFADPLSPDRIVGGTTTTTSSGGVGDAAAPLLRTNASSSSLGLSSDSVSYDAVGSGGGGGGGASVALHERKNAPASAAAGAEIESARPDSVLVTPSKPVRRRSIDSSRSSHFDDAEPAEVESCCVEADDICSCGLCWCIPYSFGLSIPAKIKVLLAMQLTIVSYLWFTSAVASGTTYYNTCLVDADCYAFPISASAFTYDVNSIDCMSLPLSPAAAGDSDDSRGSGSGIPFLGNQTLTGSLIVCYMWQPPNLTNYLAALATAVNTPSLTSVCLLSSCRNDWWWW